MDKSMIKRVFSDNLELPKEVIYDIPQLKILGDREVYVENHKGIIEYTEEVLRLNSKIGIIKIYGNNLCIKEISHEDISIIGEIKTIEFIR